MKPAVARSYSCVRRETTQVAGRCAASQAARYLLGAPPSWAPAAHTPEASARVVAAAAALARSVDSICQAEATALWRLLARGAQTRPAVVHSLVALLSAPVAALPARPAALRLRGGGHAVAAVTSVCPDSPQLVALRFVHEAVAAPAFAAALAEARDGVRSLCRMLLAAPDEEQRMAAVSLRRLAGAHAPARGLLEECLDPGAVRTLLAERGEAALVRALGAEFRGMRLRGGDGPVLDGPRSDGGVGAADAEGLNGAPSRDAGWFSHGAGSAEPSDDAVSEFAIENTETVRAHTEL